MTGTKYVVALVAVPLFAYLIFFTPPWTLNIVIALSTWLGLIEYNSLIGAVESWRPSALQRVAAGVLGFAVLAAGFANAPTAATALALLGMGTLAILECVGPTRIYDGPVRVSLTSFGFLYCTWLCGAHLMLLRHLGNGAIGSGAIAFTFFVVWLGDTGALHAGAAWGRRKLAPMVSPKKTVEGLIGGVVTNVVASLIGSWLFFTELGLGDALLLGLGIGFFAHGGDLVESLFKRAVGVKDSSAWIPGHGGFLDRMDSVAFTAPLVYYYTLLCVLPGTLAAGAPPIHP